jgi:NADH-quinone oxidoreductase subunit M
VTTLLDVVLFLPIGLFLLVLLIPREMGETVRIFSTIVSIIVFLVSLGLVANFDFTQPGYQFVTQFQWVESPNIQYKIGLDGLSLWLVVLTTFVTPIAIMISWKAIDFRLKEFHAYILLLEFCLIGIFVSIDLFQYYVFWELALVPLYFMIGIWGHGRKIYAAVKFFLYTLAGSVMMLAAILYLYNRAGSFDYEVLVAQISSGALQFTTLEETLLFWAFFVAFAVKTPLFPLHTWLPDAHVEAPTAGSVDLAALMLKVGTYSMIRFCLPLFPSAAREFAPWILTISVIGIIYGAFVSLAQPNMKKLVAYSSVSHMGLVVVGIFSLTQQGLDGAVYLMLAHGISTGALFIFVGFLTDRKDSLEIKDYGGLVHSAPALSTVFMFFVLASVGLPLMANFVGEFLALQGAVQANFWMGVAAATTLVLSACYMLWLYQRVFYGEEPADLQKEIYDMQPREWGAMLPMVAVLLWLGTYSQSFMPAISMANASVLEKVNARVEMQVKQNEPAGNPAQGVPVTPAAEVLGAR